MAKVHPRRQLRLADEHLRERRVLRCIGEHALDRHRAREAFGPDRVRAKHLGHAASAERRIEHVLAEPHGAATFDLRPVTGPGG
jgi:hypothetical protein